LPAAVPDPVRVMRSFCSTLNIGGILIAQAQARCDALYDDRKMRPVRDLSGQRALAGSFDRHATARFRARGWRGGFAVTGRDDAY